jgi:hypothetical protein
MVDGLPSTPWPTNGMLLFSNSSFLVPEFVPQVERFGLAMGALKFQTFRRELGLRCNKIISQRLTYLGMREILSAVFAC